MVCSLRSGSFNIEDEIMVLFFKLNLYSFLHHIYNSDLKGLTIDEISFDILEDTLVITVCDKQEVINLSIVSSYGFEFDKEEGLISFYFSDKNEETTFVTQFIIKDKFYSTNGEVFVKKFVC